MIDTNYVINLTYITNIDSLDTDKLSIAGGTEMTSIKDEDNMASYMSPDFKLSEELIVVIETFIKK